MHLIRSLGAAACTTAVLVGSLVTKAYSGPVVCTTTLEAPLDGGGVVEISRCGPVTTTQELVEGRYFSWTGPYARGVSAVNQLTDVLGIAMGGREGNRVMGLGFPDQTIVWDGSAVENTYQVLMDQQSTPLPWRTADVSNGFCQGLPQGGCSNLSAPVRGLW